MLDRFVGWWFLIVHLHSLSNKVRQVAQTPSSSGFQPFPFTVVISAFCSTPAFVLGFRMSPSFYILMDSPPPLGCVFNFSPKNGCFYVLFLYVSCSKRSYPDTLCTTKKSCPSYGSTVIYGALLLFFPWKFWSRSCARRSNRATTRSCASFILTSGPTARRAGARRSPRSWDSDGEGGVKPWL